MKSYKHMRLIPIEKHKLKKKKKFEKIIKLPKKKKIEKPVKWKRL